MKGPGIKDYLNIIQQKKQEAHDQGLKEIEISSKLLHQEVSADFATMPTCCQAIYKLLLEGDEVIQRPRGQTGFGSHLTVRYYVDNLQGREILFPPKKRGRPAKSEEQRKREKILRTSYNSEDLVQIISVWLSERGWNAMEGSNRIVAEKEGQRWTIDVQGTRRGRKQTLNKRINEMLKEVEVENIQESVRYSVAFNDTSLYRKQWNDIPRLLKDQLKVSVILADKNGKIQEVK